MCDLLSKTWNELLHKLNHFINFCVQTPGFSCMSIRLRVFPEIRLIEIRMCVERTLFVNRKNAREFYRWFYIECNELCYFTRQGSKALELFQWMRVYATANENFMYATLFLLSISVVQLRSYGLKETLTQRHCVSFLIFCQLNAYFVQLDTFQGVYCCVVVHGFISLLKHRHLNFLTCSQTKFHQTIGVLGRKSAKNWKALDDEENRTVNLLFS